MVRRVVVAGAVLLFGIWLFVNWGRVTGDADAFVRFSLGVIFALLVLLRHKHPDTPRSALPGWMLPVGLLGAMLAAILGIIFRVHMLEWLGVLCLLATCCIWAFPAKYRKDVLLASVILLWVHPLPGQLFGWLQGGMQRLSVLGSERILHTFNVRVWGDGMVLRTGYQNFLVPEACSGMRTSVTVFLCALGVGLLLRLKWFETLAFVVLGLLQVLLLNIARISFMVVWAPRMPPAWAEHFLHDSLGLFLMIAIVLVQLEAGWWHWWSRRRAYMRDAVQRKEIEPPELASIVPHALRRLVFVAAILAGVSLVGFGAFGLAYKSRAFHHKEMVREVAQGLLETDPVAADRALRTIRPGFPDDRDLLALQAHAELLQGNFEHALLLLDALQAGGGGLTLQEKIMQAWSLSRVGHVTEARRVVNGLDQASDRIPGVAMLKAEFAAMDGLPAETSRYVVDASAAYRLLPRIRALFPFLARHEQWEAIARADQDRPYQTFTHALIALYANQHTGNRPGLIRAMRQTLASWPADPQLMGLLFEIATQRRGGVWEDHFETNLRANLQQLPVNDLALAAKYCWRLARPDLAWLVYLQWMRVAPDDPELLAAPARFGMDWTQIRRHMIGVPSDGTRNLLDLNPLLQMFQAVDPFAGVYRRIPMLPAARKIQSGASMTPFLLASLLELEQRRARGDTLSLRLVRLEPMLLAMLERCEEAHAVLDRMLVAFPEQEPAVLLQHAQLYDRQQRWADSYETLFQRRTLLDQQSLRADLLEIGARMNLNMGMAAMVQLQESRKRYPGAVQLDLAESAIWNAFGFKAQALHVLQRTPAGAGSALAADLYEQTGRLEEARQLRSKLDVPRSRTVRLETPLWLPPADWAVTPRWPEPPDADEIRTELVSLRQQRKQADASPFLHGLRDLQVQWYEQLAADGYAAAGQREWESILMPWEAVGRTPLEKASGLYQIAMYAARQADRHLALQALERALAWVPESAVLWRARIALVEQDPDVIRAAHEAVPQDPELFLGALVVGLAQLTGDAAKAWLQKMRAFALAQENFPVETLVRAGSHVLAQGWAEEAIPLAKAVADRAGGLLAGHVFVMRVAMMNGDAEWALRATQRANEVAVDKTPLYKALVDLKLASREVDSDLLTALEYLRVREPEDSRWSEALGAMYFERGDLQRALTVFGSVIDEDIRGVQVRSLLLAAESARLQNDWERAVRILDAAHALQPDQPQILNNLVYVLAQREETLPRARAMLPRLLELDSTSFPVLDTAAQVAMRSDNLEAAETWIQKAMDAVDMDAYGAHEVRLNWAELQMRRGNRQAARRALKQIRQETARPDYVDQRARQMLRELDQGLP